MTFRYTRIVMKTRNIKLLVIVIAIFFGGMYLLRGEVIKVRDDQDKVKSTSGFNSERYSISKPGSIWWIVNKNRPLPAGYVPPNLSVPNVTRRLDKDNESMKIDSAITKNIEELFSAAKQAGHPLVFASGYRSEEYQRQLFQRYVQEGGQEYADKTSAKPGTSEHQTGLAFDVCEVNTDCELETSFGNTNAGRWVKDNAYKYGFIVRYLEGKENETGYTYEPWHLRYVGADLANELYNSNQTMEDFFKVK